MTRNGIMPVQTRPESLKENANRQGSASWAKSLSLSQLSRLLITPTAQEFHRDKIR